MRRHACKAAAHSLEQEGHDVAGDENARVGKRCDARVGRAEGVYHAGEAEIETRGHEGRGDGQADDLDQETILRSHGVSQVYADQNQNSQSGAKTDLVKGGAMTPDSSGIAQNFQDAAADHGHGEADEASGKEGLVEEAKEGEGEEGEDDGIAGESGQVVPV